MRLHSETYCHYTTNHRYIILLFVQEGNRAVEVRIFPGLKKFKTPASAAKTMAPVFRKGFVYRHGCITTGVTLQQHNIELQ
jgi:hypothetical protein